MREAAAAGAAREALRRLVRRGDSLHLREKQKVVIIIITIFITAAI